jgi:hypothetical protein
MPMTSVAGDFYDFLVANDPRLDYSLPMFRDTACLQPSLPQWGSSRHVAAC